MSSSHLTILATLAFLLLLAPNLWAIAAAKRGQIRLSEVLLIECATLATASATAGWVELHYVFKPLTLLVAIAMVAVWRPPSAPHSTSAKKTPSARPEAKTWLLIALAGSLAGDGGERVDCGGLPVRQCTEQ